MTKETKVKFTFPVSSGLLTPTHVARMKTNLWCFLWCINRTTEDRVLGEERIGKVLGGHAVQPSRIAYELGLPEREILAQLNGLSAEGYVQLHPIYDGFVIDVPRSIKWLARGKKKAPAPEDHSLPSLLSGVKILQEERKANEAKEGKHE